MISTMISYSQDFSNLNGISLHASNCIVGKKTPNNEIYDINELFVFSFNDNIFIHTILYLTDMSTEISQIYQITKKEVGKFEGGFVYHVTVQSGTSKIFYKYDIFVSRIDGSAVIMSIDNNMLYYGSSFYVKSFKQ